MKIPAILIKIITTYFRWVAIGMAVLVIALGYSALLAKKIETIQKTSLDERSHLTKAVAAETKYLDDLTKSIDGFQRALSADQRQVINRFLPSSPDLPSLLMTMNMIGASAGQQLVSLSLGQSGSTAATTSGTSPTSGAPAANAATVGGLSVQTQDFTVQFTGGKNYRDFRAILALIESSQRLFDVTNYSFSHDASTEGAAGGGAYNFTLRTYYLASPMK